MTAPRPRAVRTTSPAETEGLGRCLGALLRAGDVVALSGDLGAGKTVLARGIAEGAGTRGHIASPTFTLIREYHGPVVVYHADLFRLDEPAQLADVGLEEVLDGAGVTIIEWAEKARALLPAEYLGIEIRFTDQEEVREILLVPYGARYEAMVGRLLGRQGERDAHPGD
ncbi:MAG: tRNA (adenosine(37)-N6)-threonylcarbamoyltransferase complex ATPase subunit type 1 TsaE [Armatimonadota bacterium]|nr:tRNA (adenosine(37)-N6)-threonylcarbamoyltransferase complex ATPase subunit type 1 TsaE [Armatimonadota bacterium]MDR7452596.1 tRNA (adenosine(37)-N6)-threonylcarbamoyltransferase complex ATPase subunit type 1 TsaE [Armatimonadota bacterium]MDR7468243.1 tRNA (adenosine(37)-N6)-threonylcarbamoyltransferase complex ATPase subunit type 1 TsaE [Armatimonadota bacterium]MDR7495237.1 tRNA (adenosine(37)-N6)-threonylcarbamoyltransferase complex ATPase subunit type 1 TsaE [Armatimonadota bacterium]M